MTHGQLVRIFTEWARRVAADPAAFDPAWLAGDPQATGAAAAKYFEQLDADLRAPGPGSGLTTDRNDPRLTHGIDERPVPQADAYLVLSEEERAKGFVRPVRRDYLHTGRTPEINGIVLIRASADGCGGLTKMGLELCETYARDPNFYGSTYCVGCGRHRPVAEFRWAVDGAVVGS